MYPEQNQPGRPISDMDYLDQISVKPPSKLSFINRKILIAVIAFVVLITVLMIATVLTSNRSTGGSETLSVQFSSLNSIIDYGSSNEINSSEVNKAVAEASLVVASAEFQLSSVVTLPAPSKEALALEAIDDTIETLDQAQSTGNLSRKYTETLRSKLEAVIISLNQLHDQTGSESSRQTISTIIADFTEIYNRLNAIY